jgi:UDP-N-acetylmuramate dehydrogenase
MKVIEKPSLKALNTFSVEANASLLIGIEKEEDVLELPCFDPNRDYLLGDGSNTLFVSNVPGTVYHNRLLGKEIIESYGGHALIEVGAGENWHGLVCWALDRELFGLENLALIPGRAGAAPIQNIGAYGAELSSVLDSVTAWDWQRAAWVRFTREDCQLGYRDSLFRSGPPGHYLITSIRLRLSRRFEPRLEYPELRSELSAMGLDKPSARDVSNAVIRLRRRKLPDPEAIGNAGSFFKNPLVSEKRGRTLARQHPGLAIWPARPGWSKLSAAWMVERCGLKGLRQGDAGVSAQHALVLVNHGRASGRDIARLADHVKNAVAERFEVELEPEPTLVEFPQ